MKRDEKWVLFLSVLGLVLFFFSVNVRAGCIGDSCELDWESCDWNTYTGTTSLDFNNETFAVGDFYVSPYIARVNYVDSNGGVPDGRNTLVQIVAQSTNQTSRVDNRVHIASGSLNSNDFQYQYTDINTCSFVGASGVMEILPEDLADLGEAMQTVFVPVAGLLLLCLGGGIVLGAAKNWKV